MTTSNSRVPGAVGQVISQNAGKFKLDKKLGEGAMGEVWLAYDAELNRRVALKFMKGAEPEEIARFKREAQVVAKLNHPNICAIYEAGDGYIAMQYVEGRTLKDLPGRDIRVIAQAVRDAALAVHYAHECDIIHRDLKPANIMFETAKTGRSTVETVRVSKGLRIYVMDFGLAKQLGAKSSLSVSGMIVGTPSYMSPEQAEGDARKIGSHSDIYSLGATLYDLLTGRPPHQGLGVYDTLKKVVDEEPVPVRKLNRQVDSDLAIIVHKAMAKEPSARYRTAAALAEDLDRWMNSEPIAARPPSIAEKVLKVARKNRAAVLVGGVVALISAVALGWSITSGIRERDRAQAAEIEKLRAEAKARDAEIERQRIEEKAKDAEFQRLRRVEMIHCARNERAQGNWQEAERLVDEVLRQEPKNVNALDEKAVILATAKEDFEGAIAYYKTSYAITPNKIVANGIAKAYGRLGKYKESCEWFKDSWMAMKNPNDAIAYAVALAYTGNSDEAVAILQKVGEEWPSQKPAADELIRQIRAAENNRDK